MASETISIIILTYNRKWLLTDCLDSLLSQSSNGDGLEILVADDGSDDGTRELVANYSARHANVKWLYHKHQGIAATRNLGIRAAKGEIIAIVADDYILDKDYIKVILEFFRNRPEASVVRFKIVASRSDYGSRVSHFYYDVSMRRRLSRNTINESDRRPGARGGFFKDIPEPSEEVTVHHQLEASGAAAFRRAVFDQVGLFDESLPRGEDTDLTLRLRGRGIEVYYYPHLTVQHQYEHLMLDTVRKSFESGWSRYRYFHKHSIALALKDGGPHPSFRLRFEGLVNALRHLETVGQFVTYAPFIALFEVANKLGYFCARIFSKREDAKEKTVAPRTT